MAWRVMSVRGATVDRRSGKVPGGVTLTPSAGPRVDLRLTLEYRGAQVTAPRGAVSAAGGADTFGYTAATFRGSVEQTVGKQKLIRRITTQCKDLGMIVVAEGVETAAERDSLIELGCNLLQGYLFARPTPDFQQGVW